MTKNVVSSAGKKGGGGHGDWACRKCGGSGGGGDDGGSKQGLRKGPWTVKEDALLIEYVKNHGEKHWNCVQKIGLMRCGKSCRLRWTNHLRPDLKKGAFTSEEQRIVLQLHDKLGNKWSKIAAQLPGRTDNEIKNFWNTKMRKMKTKLQTELQIPKNSQQESNALDLEQQKNQQAQTHENPPSTPPPPPYRSLLSPISPQKPSFNLPLPPSNLICTMQNDHTMPLLENPAYKFKFHPEEDEEDSHNINGRLLPSSSVTQTPSSQFDYGTLYNYVLPNFGNNIVSVHRRIELPSSQIHFPETYTSTILGVGCMQGKNQEDEKSWGMEERKFDLVGRMNEDVGREMASISTGRELDDGNPAQSCKGMKSRKKEPVEEIESMDDDLLSLLSNFSSIESPPVWLITGGDMLNRNQKEPTATVVATSTIPNDASTTTSSQSNMP